MKSIKQCSLATIVSISMISCIDSTVEHPTDDPVVQIQPQKSSQLAEPSGPSKKELLQYVLKLTDTSSPFTSQDKEFLESLKGAEQDHITEAAIVVGSLRLAMLTPRPPKEGETPAPTSELPAPTANEEVKPFSLQSYLSSYQIDLSTALTNNLALRKYSVYRLAAQAIKVSADQESYIAAIDSLIKEEAHAWASLLNQGDLTPEESDLQAEPSYNEPEPAHLSAAELRNSDLIISKAEAAASAGQHREAISLLMNIAEEDPLYAPAQELITKYQNDAVQALRQEAAAAYQSAIPSQDLPTKSSYLEKARQLLQEALAQYPEAAQIPTVKANLAVIVSDIEKIKSQASPGQTPDQSQSTSPSPEAEDQSSESPED